MGIGEVSETEEKICKMTAEELALLLCFIGSRNIQFPCMMETKIWRIARKFTKDGVGLTKKSAIEALELLVRAIKACDEEGENDV